MKTIGLIGGTSWHSTIEYYRYINRLVDEATGTNPPLLMYSLNVELMRRGNWEEIIQEYVSIAMTLEQAGAEAILICANTPHKVYPVVQPKLKIPILHIADATAEEAHRLGITSLGLLGTKPTMQEDFIKGKLKADHGLEVIVPDEPTQEKIHSLIAEDLTRGKFEEKTKTYFIKEMSKLEADGASGIILGCTELPLLIKSRDFGLPMLDTTYLHAKMAVDFILG